MIKITTEIPDWLHTVVDFLNEEFKEDEYVTVSILYGYDSICSSEDDCGFAVYNTETKHIYLADPYVIKETFEDITEEDMKETTIYNLLHEYRHHQQNIYKWDFDEDDAEYFAEQIYSYYISIESYL